MLRIQAAGQKSGEYELLPLASDFQEFLRATPENQRTGFVFNPRPIRPPHDVRLLPDWVGKVIAKIGEEADVRVAEVIRRGKPYTKFATAHDFRRVIGERWAPLVMPKVLQQLMRHKSISTTEKFYDRKNAEQAADAAKRAFGDTPPISPPSGNPNIQETPEN